MRWRTLKRHRPPRGKQLLVYDPTMKGRRDVLDDGTRLGYYDGLRLRAADEAPGEYLRWLPYPAPPRLERAPATAVTIEMQLLLDRLRAAQRRGELLPHRAFAAGEHGSKLSTLRALARRGILRNEPSSTTRFLFAA
jgi:hypothetical protein